MSRFYKVPFWSLIGSVNKPYHEVSATTMQGLQRQYRLSSDQGHFGLVPFFAIDPSPQKPYLRADHFTGEESSGPVASFSTSDLYRVALCRT